LNITTLAFKESKKRERKKEKEINDKNFRQSKKISDYNNDL